MTKNLPPKKAIEFRAPAALKPHPRNSRLHDDAQISALRESIRRFGFTRPVLVDENDTILAGHGAVRAAIAEGISEVPVVIARGWSDRQKRAYVIADNKLAQNSSWDEALLSTEIADLIGDFQSTLGFSPDELADLMNGAVTFELPEPPESVASNVEKIADVKRARRAANERTSDKNDTEHYLVIVFGTRAEREAALKRLGLPVDERYVLSRAVRIERRFGADLGKVDAGRDTTVADPKHSGACG